MMWHTPTMEHLPTRTRSQACLAVLDASAHRPLDPACVRQHATGRWITAHPGQEVPRC